MSDILIINDILNAAAERKATDVHLVAGNSPVIRVDGRLITLVDQPVLTGEILAGLAESFLSKEKFDKLSQEKEVVTIYNWADRSRYRAILQLLNREKGLIIITGPFGSGRTSTAVSLIETLNQNKGIHIQTLEKPIEYLFSNNQSVIEQRSVGTDVNTFVDGLKNMLDEDVDAVFVDCSHEAGVEEVILELVESGKLLIFIMDADSVISALDRFISNITASKKDWGRGVLADTLLGAMAQRLLARVGGGMTMASEVLLNNPAVRSSIKDDKLSQLSSIMQTSREEAMASFDKALLELVRVGEISIEDARNQAVDSHSFK